MEAKNQVEKKIEVKLPDLKYIGKCAILLSGLFR